MIDGIRRKEYNVLPYLTIEDDGLVLLKNGTVSFIIKIESNDRYDTEERIYRQQLVDDIKDYIYKIPENYSIQIINDIKVKKAKKENEIFTNNTRINYSRMKRNQYCQNTDYFENNIYISISKNKRQLGKIGIFNTIFNTNIDKIEDIEKEIKKNKEELENNYQRLKQKLEKNNLKLKKLNGNECAKYIAESINLKEIKREKFTLDGYTSNNELAQKKYNIDKKTGDFTIGDNYLKIITMDRYPEYSQPINKHKNDYDVPFLHPILFGMSDTLELKPHKVIINIHKINTDKEKYRIERNLKNSKMFTENEDIKTMEEEVTALKKEVAREYKQLVKIGVHVLIWDLDKKELSKRANIVLDKYNEIRNSTGYIEKNTTANLFSSCLPGNSQDDFRTATKKAEVVANLPNLYTYYRGSKTGLLFKNRKNKTVCYRHFKDPRTTNSNAFVIGPTGSGKSYFMNDMAMQLAENGSKLFILDKGGSYLRTIKYLKGEYYQFDIDNMLSINPFKIEHTRLKNSKTVIPIRKMIHLNEHIKNLITEEKDKIGITLDEKINNAIKNLYKNKYDEILNNKYPRLEDFYNEFKKSKYDIRGIKEYRKRLEAYMNDPIFSSVINSEDKVNIGHSDYIYFDVEGMPDRVKPILVPQISYKIEDQISKYPKSVKKTFIADEFWKMLESNQGMSKLGDKIKEYYRVYRKMGGSMISITQSAKDINFPGLEEALKINISMLYILKHDAEQLKDVYETFDFTDNQKRLLKTLQVAKDYREVFIRKTTKTQGTLASILRVDVSKIHHMLYTTESDDMEKYEKQITKDNAISDLENIEKKGE